MMRIQEVILGSGGSSEPKKPVKEKWPGLDLSNMGLRWINPSISHYRHLRDLYLNNNGLSTLPGEMFLGLKHLQILDLSQNQLTRLPEEMGQLHELKQLMFSYNFIDELSAGIFGRLFSLIYLEFKGNPISSPSSSVLTRRAQDIFAYFRDQLKVPEPPPRKMHVVTNKETSTYKDCHQVKILDYNVLANIYATEERHPYCPSWARDWNYRKKKILEKILNHDADIVCLQEVESLQYREFFVPHLSEKGYASVFMVKSRYRTISGPSKEAVDGCALFYKRERFSVADKTIMIEFQSLCLGKYSDKIGKPVFDRLMLKDNVAVGLVLEFKEKTGKGPKRKLLIANTHIHWNPEYADVKLMQTQMFLSELETVRAKHGGEDLPVIICGDFNSTPDSSVYELVTKAEIPPEHPALKKLDYGLYSKEGMSHSLDLACAYSQTEGGGPELEFTNIGVDFVGVLDYIFCSQRNVKVAEFLTGVPKSVVTSQFGALPNPHFPSDHLAIVATVLIPKDPKTAFTMM